MKNALFTLLLAGWLLLAAPFSAAALELSAQSAILIDAASGKILFQQNSHQSLPVASTTKILTALLTLEHIEDLSTTVTVPEDFANVGQSSIWLEAGETHSVEDLLYALMLRSANDAGQMLARAVAGSEEAFAIIMNEKMVELGLADSSWSNPHGLHAEGHYSSAYDLAFITKEAMRYPLFNTLISTYSWQLPAKPGEDAERVVFNHNKFLSQYEGADGVKTGYVRQSGSCLVGSATREGLRLIGVVLNCDSSEIMYQEMAELMDYGFANFGLRQVAAAGQVIETLPVNNARQREIGVVLGENLQLVMDKQSTYLPKGTVQLPASLDTPVDSSTAIGSIIFDDGEGNLCKGELYPAEDLGRYTFWGVLASMWQRVWSILM